MARRTGGRGTKESMADEAYAAGMRAARSESPSPPSFVLLAASLEARWRQGVEDGRREARGVRERVPVLDTRALPDVERVTPETHPTYFWDEARDGPRPTAFERRRIYPCPSCGRRLADDSGQALTVYSRTENVVYMRCRACGERSKLPIGV